MDAADLAGLIAARARPGETLLVGLTGSVAAGKTTLSDELAIILARDRKVQTLATDGFLLPNSLLAERGLLGRKGFPETYDSAGLVALMKAARQGPVTAPVYSHTIYDVDPARTIAIDRPDILILDGLGLAPIDGDRSVADALDILIYIDADEADLEVWYIDRFVGF